MQTQAILGLIIFAVAIWTAFRVFRNIFEGILLIGLAIVATALVIGGTPEIGSLPVVGKILPQYNVSSTDVIVAVKGFAWGIKILAVDQAGNGDMLIAVANTGQLDLSDYKVFVAGQRVPVVNLPRTPLKKGETTVIETNQFAGNNVNVTIEAGYAKDEFLKP